MMRSRSMPCTARPSLAALQLSGSAGDDVIRVGELSSRGGNDQRRKRAPTPSAHGMGRKQPSLGALERIAFSADRPPTCWMAVTGMTNSQGMGARTDSPEMSALTSHIGIPQTRSSTLQIVWPDTNPVPSGLASLLQEWHNEDPPVDTWDELIDDALDTSRADIVRFRLAVTDLDGHPLPNNTVTVGETTPFARVRPGRAT